MLYPVNVNLAVFLGKLNRLDRLIIKAWPMCELKTQLVEINILFLFFCCFAFNIKCDLTVCRLVLEKNQFNAFRIFLELVNWFVCLFFVCFFVLCLAFTTF